MPLIIVVTGPNNGDYHPVSEKPVIIGRDDKCDLQIVDPVVSRRHLQMTYDPEAQCGKAQNLGSTNGMRVNDSEVAGEATLSDGDVIQIGDTLLLFVVNDENDVQEAVNNYRRRSVSRHSTMIR